MNANKLLVIFLLLLPSVAALLNSAPQIAPVEIMCAPRHIEAFQGEKVMLSVSVKNNSTESIRPDQDFFFSYHLYDSNKRLIAYDNRRFKIPRVLRRRKTTAFQVPVYFDVAKSGRYILEFDIVKERSFWGSSKKWKTAEVDLHLKPLFSSQFKKQYMARGYTTTGSDLLDKEQHLLRLTLKNCELRKNGALFGFAPGSTYPAVWIRDTATFIALAKQYYPIDSLMGSVELFLQHQGETGEIMDKVDAEGKTDKNTVETDQESSLLIAACHLAETKTAWLKKKINGKTVYRRLEDALQWVWQNRRDKKWNLITSGFTADWGDVENSYPDKRARKLSDRSILAFGIYTQAKYIQAMDRFIKLSQQLQQSKKDALWRGRMETLKKNTRKHLYLKDKGYFITHITPSTNKYFKMEKEMLAVGGNAEAILAGLMSRAEVKTFLEVLKQKRSKYDLHTVSCTLLPPYPEGFFPHHLLKHPWNYQNGGQWDWIGGRVVQALLKSGFDKEAEAFLLEIVKKNIADFCIFEWEDRKGTGRGALFYVGAAGVLGEALLQRNGIKK